ncbi:MAG: D-glycero-beta-D-manno-heptose-7-phosphate kinase [Bacteroidia bacterium]|nr:D-glycero-beta-D-manno-heptose-7-phosphate kinase [Bacteroidia bacterium]
MDEIFATFNHQRVLIIGDVMIDSYLWGEVNRISPEAPVPVVQVKKREKRLGGAANVAVNIQALGAEPILCSLIGTDPDAHNFLELLADLKLNAAGILRSPDRVTTIKHRILSGHQHMLRVDSETNTPINPPERQQLFQKIESMLPDCDVIIFEDYDKGVIDEVLIQQVINLARLRGIPTVVDPKKRNFLSYYGATLFKPNLKELKEGLQSDFDGQNPDELSRAVRRLKERLQLQQVLVTLSERGVYLDSDETQCWIPAHLRSIADVSGAGDTVVSVAALGTALHLPPKLTAALANLAGGLVCEYVGVVSIEKSKLLKEAIDKKLFPV